MQSPEKFTNDNMAELFPSAAVEQLQMAIEKNADDAWALHGLALIKIGLGEYTEALAALQRALSLAPDFALALRTLSRLYGLLGCQALRVETQERAEALEREAYRLADQRQPSSEIISRLLSYSQ